MYQYSRRLLEAINISEKVLELLTEAGSACLASINALHLAGPNNDWVSIPAQGSDEIFDEVSPNDSLVIHPFYFHFKFTNTKP
jgi:hypothetical protein